MDFFNTHQNQQKQYHHHQHHYNPSPKLSNKKRFTQDQVTLLERSFTANKKLEPELKLQLANQLGVPPRQVAIWYQNKRARWKTQSLELDYNTLQVKLENALADKKRFEREVMQLQDELRRTQEMVFALNNIGGGGGGGVALPPLNVSCNNSSCEDGGSSNNLHEDVNNGEVLQLDELYACLIGGCAGSTWG